MFWEWIRHFFTFVKVFFRHFCNTSVLKRNPILRLAGHRMGCGCFVKGRDWHLLCHIVENVHDNDIVFEAFDEAVDIFLVPRGRAHAWWVVCARTKKTWFRSHGLRDTYRCGHNSWSQRKYPAVADFLNPPQQIIRIFNPQNHQTPELTHHLYKIYPLYPLWRISSIRHSIL